MPSNRAGRPGRASLRQGGDPRARRNAQRQTLDEGALAIPNVRKGATLEDLIASHNALLESLRDARLLRR